MTKGMIAAAFACAALAMPAVALADDAMSGGSMKHDAMGSGKMATMVCRAAAPNEKPTAMMMGDTKKPLVCKTISPDKMMHKGTGGPDLSKALSAEQVDAAWREFIQSQIMVPANGGG